MSNSLIFSIGSFGSKIIVFVMVPFYTYVLSSSEFGTVDLVTTISTMLLPVFSLSIYEAVLRFTMDTTNKKEILSSSLSLVFFVGIIMLPIIMFAYFFINTSLVLFLWMILICQSIQMILSQFVRAIGLIKLFSLNGILMTLILMISNIVLLVPMGLGIKGYLTSIIISNIFSIFFLLITGRLYVFIDLFYLNRSITRKMLKYSLPLIPNSIMWWIINASSRLFIVYFISSSANGIFAVASKIPGIVNVLYTVFIQAWQLSAIEEYKSSDAVSEFYTKIFNFLVIFLIIISSTITLFSKQLVPLLVSAEFVDSWKYIPLLLLATVFSAFSSFVGTTYTVSMDTKGVFVSSVTGAGISLLLNLLLIPKIGVIGAALSQVISFIYIWIFRHIQTKNIVNIVISAKSYFIIIFFSLQTIFSLINFASIIYYMIQIICMLIILLLCKRELFTILSSLRQMLSRRS